MLGQVRSARSPSLVRRVVGHPDRTKNKTCLKGAGSVKSQQRPSSSPYLFQPVLGQSGRVGPQTSMNKSSLPRPPVPSSSASLDQGGGSVRKGAVEPERKKDKSEAGVGFLVHKSLAGNVTEFKGVNERLAQLTIKINKRYSLKIIQVYAPTSSYDDEEVEKLYEEINELLQNNKTHFTIMMGDLNAKVGKKEDGEESVIGNFGHGQRNDRGDRLVEFAISSKLKILNTFFKKKANRKWTWISPDRATKNEIDFIFSSDLNIVKDVNVLNKVNIGSDHRMEWEVSNQH
ncbi:hypothetical protein BSL78_06870 [Apostichopus japonicus]|uniref:Endonuclease/exonuclease/phosphatase domain-containing protein n=1 Tax=Stichopus japonicus TaxID=307972 RepID=A0A2G8L7J7_STIJA|nr:hypothetical protein BSL78_06870 [Apostichopus japonicus]